MYKSDNSAVKLIIKHLVYYNYLPASNSLLVLVLTAMGEPYPLTCTNQISLLPWRGCTSLQVRDMNDGEVIQQCTRPTAEEGWLAWTELRGVVAGWGGWVVYHPPQPT